MLELSLSQFKGHGTGPCDSEVMELQMQLGPEAKECGQDLVSLILSLLALRPPGWLCCEPGLPLPLPGCLSVSQPMFAGLVYTRVSRSTDWMAQVPCPALHQSQEIMF